MIQFSQSVINVLQGSVVEAFYMVTIGTYKTTSFYSNVTLSNQETFLSDGKLIKVDPPQLDTVVDKASFNVTIADPSSVFGQYADNGLVGDPFEVRLGFLNSSEQPLLNIADTLLVYKGIVDQTAYSISTQEIGEALLLITGSSPMSNLDLVKGFYTSKDFIRNINTTDTSFDQVYEGAGAVNLKWGRI